MPGGDLSALLGAEAVEALARQYGGGYVSVPRRFRHGLKIVGVIGAPAARKLIARHSGCRVYVPQGDKSAARNRVIAAQHRRGWSIARIARQHRLSERWIYRLLRGGCR